MAAVTPELPPLPIVGRTREMAVVRTSMDRAAAGRGGTVLLTGPAGSGKSRLTQAIREEGERRGFLVSIGCAYPMESGVPYSVFCDLLDPLVRVESPEVLIAWTRGTPEFRLLCPSLVVEDSGASADTPEEMSDFRSRLLWNLPSFLDRLRRDRPLLFILEDLEWADPSSLELFHFLGRRSSEYPFLFVGTFGSEEAEARADVGNMARALEARSEAIVLDLEPLGPQDVLEVVSRVFHVFPDVVRGFSETLHHWTGGSPFFLHSILESLLASGRIRKEGDRWVGWSLDEPALPTSVHDLVRKQLNSLTAPARRVVELAVAVGAHARFEVLREASGLESAKLLAGLQELQERRILQEGQQENEVVYSFVHPIVQDVLHAELGLARSRLLHTELSRTLERLYGAESIHHAEELAAHILHGSGGGTEVDRAREATYLAAAGRRALESHGNEEAARCLGAALDRIHGSAGGGGSIPDRYDLLVDLARARQRLGCHDEAEELLRQALEVAVGGPDHTRVAKVARRLGLAMFWARRPEEALGHWERGLESAQEACDPILEARIRLGKSMCLQEAGQPEEAAREAEGALRIGEKEEDGEIRYAAHRTLALLHTWTGPPDTARRHGRRALALVEELAKDAAVFSAHRTLAVLEGLTGHPADARRHLEAASVIAERLGSPLLKLELADVQIEYCAGLGHWDHGMDLAEESIRMARELNQRMTLPRLLVWSGLLHLDRGDVEVARKQITEAWNLAEVADGFHPDAIQMAILAHIGLTALHLASGEHADAIRVGEEGMKLVDRSGYRIWAIHRLLPIMAEAALHQQDLDRARQIADRLRRESKAFGHPVGLVWADTCDALVTWLGGDVERGAREMAVAADRLESIDTVPYAARLRRQLAGRLAEIGERDAAIRELRRVHDILSALGAEPELDKTRGQFREVGARPPTRSATHGTGVLTPREEEVARLVGQRKSNKAIGKELGLSPRTVGTHLTNIFRKLGLDSRSRLGDLVRTGLLDEGS